MVTEKIFTREKAIRALREWDECCENYVSMSCRNFGMSGMAR